MSAPPNPPATPAPPKPTLGNEPNHTLLWDMLRKRPHPLVSIAYTVPVFLVYHLGIAYIMKLQRFHEVDFDLMATELEALRHGSLRIDDPCREATSWLDDRIAAAPGGTASPHGR